MSRSDAPAALIGPLFKIKLKKIFVVEVIILDYIKLNFTSLKLKLFK